MCASVINNNKHKAHQCKDLRKVLEVQCASFFEKGILRFECFQAFKMCVHVRAFQELCKMFAAGHL